jgi:predicted helicase
VAETYSRDSTASNKHDLIDPYIKAFRLASDRVLERGEGIVCFVTNNGFLDGIAFDGMRKHLRRDFDRITIIDLGGNVRKNTKLSGTTHNVFGIQVGVNITMMEHHADRADAYVRYTRMDEFWTRRQKYHELERLGDAFHCDYTDVADNTKNLWLTEGMAEDWDELIPLGSKEAKAGDANALMRIYTNGIITSRDWWMYAWTKEVLRNRATATIDFYNTEVDRCRRLNVSLKSVDSAVHNDDQKVSWSSRLKECLVRGITVDYSPQSIRKAAYRPFSSRHLYFDSVFTHRRGLFGQIYPTLSSNNIVFGLTGVGSEKPFTVNASDLIMDFAFCGGGSTYQCFPLYTYDEDGTNRKDNITDWGLEQFQSHYKDTSITKLDIFHYVYGILHDPAYRTKYAANLKRELPRIPFAENFWKVAETGKSLMDIHVHYEDQPEYPLTELWSLPKGYVHPYGLEVTSIDQVPERDRYRVTKMKRDKKDPTRLIVNDFLTLAGIPANVDDYKLGNRSALDWIIDQYQVSTDKRSGITNDPNRDDDPTYIIRLIKKVVTVSVETVGVVAGARRRLART